MTITEIRHDQRGARELWLRGDAAAPSLAGQVTRVSVGTVDAGYFALLGAPSEPEPWRLLVLPSTAEAALVCQAEVGDVLHVAAAFGRGYPAPPDQGALLYVGVGSAIAPLRSAITDALAGGVQGDRITLLYGVGAPSEVLLSGELDTWRAAGVRVQLVFSRPPLDWSGPCGYVQAHVESLVRAHAPTYVCVAGMTEMQEAVRAALTAAFVPDAAIHTNF